MPRVSAAQNREYQKKWYLKNRKLQIERNEATKLKKLQWFKEYKSNLACVSCGENHPATLDFHHRDPETKERGVSAMVYSGCSIENILEEAAKCDVLCSNCHRKLHYEMALTPVVGTHSYKVIFAGSIPDRSTRTVV